MGSSGIDISTLAEISKDPTASSNISNFLKDVAENLSHIEKILGTFEKMGASPAVLEKIAIKLGNLDKVPSLPLSEPGRAHGITPASETHKAVFEQLNGLTEKQLTDLSKKMEKGK